MRDLWINGEHVSAYGLRVLHLPPITRPKARINEINVPGRSGYLTRWRGDYDAIDLQVVLHYAGADPRAALDWLGNARTVRFGHSPEWLYDCHRKDDLAGQRVIADWHRIVLNLTCQPERRLVSEPVETGNPVTVTNTGTEPARPRIMLEPTATTVVLTVGTETWTLQGLSGWTTLDGLAGIVTDADGSAWSKLDRPDLPVIEPGETVSISATGVSQLSVMVQARWV